MNSVVKFLTASSTSFILVMLQLNSAYGQDQLRRDIAHLIQSVKADVGVAIKQMESGDTLSFNGQDHFPMQSVYKFHLALAVLNDVDQGKFSLDQEIYVRKSDLIPNTWSPIADKYPDGNINLTVKQLLSYTISHSDNNGCDILFRLVGGPGKVQEYIHSLGVHKVAIVNTEREMHQTRDLQFKNWTTPQAMVQLLELFYKKKILSPSSHNLLVEIMEHTTTGRKRIKGLLPKETTVAHKTGMGGNDEIISAINDVGIVTLPNGKHLGIALLISNTDEKIDNLEEVMAKISKQAFDYYTNYKP